MFPLQTHSPLASPQGVRFAAPLSEPPHNAERSCSPRRAMIAPSTTDRHGRRSSLEIAQAARKRLRRSPYPPLQRLSCECDDRGFLFLRGRLPSFYLKQLAQQAVLDLQGVTQIVNQTEVVPSSAPAAVST